MYLVGWGNSVAAMNGMARYETADEVRIKEDGKAQAQAVSIVMMEGILIAPDQTRRSIMKRDARD